MGTSYFERWLARGEPLVSDQRRRRQVRTANAVALLFTAISLPHVALFAVGGAPELAAWLSLGCVFYASPLWLNQRGWFLAGRSLALVTACVVATCLAMALGPASNVQVTLFMLACWAFALFDARAELGSLLVLCAVPVAGFVLVSAGVDLGIPRIPLSPGVARVMGVSGGLVGFGLFVTVLTLIKRSEQRIEDQLRETVQQLRDEVERRTHAEAEAVLALEQAQVAARAKSEFLSVVSHELRTPMNGVLGATELLGATQLDPEQRDLLDTLSSSGAFLMTLLQDVLAYSALEARELVLEPEPVDIRGLLCDCVDDVSKSADAKGLPLSLDVTPCVPYQLIVDPQRLRQVMGSLLSNAVKFTPSGRVEVRVDCDPHGPDGKVRLCVEVSDTGIGIPLAARQKIFERFTQVDASHARGYGGTGLGLAMTKSLVELCGGQIGVRDGPDGGSCFHFYCDFDRSDAVLPPQFESPPRAHVVAAQGTRRGVEDLLVFLGAQIVETPEEATLLLVDEFATLESQRQPGQQVVRLAARCGPQRAAGVLPMPLRASRLLRHLLPDAAPAAEDRASSVLPKSHTRAVRDAGGGQVARLRVLVVEDNAVNQKIILRLLQTMNVDVSVAWDGVEAVQFFETREVDLVLMDVQMPNMNGLDATRRIRSLPTAHRPVIVGVSANAYPEDARAGIEAGMDAYLGKPLKKKLLERVVAATVDGQPVAELPGAMLG